MDEISKLTKKKSEYLPGAGTYTMDGVQACAFARIRYTAGDDYKRTERQRAVLTAMIQKNTVTLGSKGSVVVPCDLKSNVIQLHQFLYDDTEYEPTDTVKSNSEKIISDTGFHQGDGY